MVNEENLETDVSTDEVNTESTSPEVDYKALLEEKEKKINDLWDKIYKLKKDNKTKTVEKTDWWVGVDEINKIMEERDFFKENPDLVEHKETISEYTSKGLSIDEAKTLLLSKDQTIANRQNTKQANFTAWEPANVAQAEYTREDLASMSQSEYNKIKALQEKWKIRVV